MQKKNALKSKVSYLLRHWKEARLQTEQAIQESPDDPYLRLQLIDTLFAIGDEAYGKRTAKQLLDTHYNHIAENDYLLIFVFFVLGDLECAIDLAKKYLIKWPHSEQRVSVICWLIRLLALNDQHEVAAEWMCKLPDTVRSEIAPLAIKQHNCILSMPLTCQGKDTCVPTAIGMICHYLGLNVDPDELYREMGCVEGTELWRAHDVMELKGLLVSYVELDVSIIKKLIDEGVPILALTNGLFSSHVEVINGYDDAEQCIYIRDPENWSPTLVRYKDIPRRYASAGNYGMCFTREKIKTTFKFSEAGANINALARYCETGALDNITPLLEKLQDHSEFELDVIQHCYGVSVDPIVYEEKLSNIIHNPKAPKHQKIRALLQTSNTDVLQAWLEDQQNNITNNRFILKYISVIRDYLNGNWDTCTSTLTDLIHLYPYQSGLWLFLAETSLEIGDIDNALKSVQRALELSPDSIWTINKVFYLFPHLLTYEQLLEKLVTYELKRPDSIASIEFASKLYQEGSCGEKFELKALECIERRPKLPNNYTRLASWYLDQDREDLASHILNRGREQLGHEQLPIWEFEKSPEDADYADENGSTKGKEKKVDESSLKLRLSRVQQDDSLGTHEKIDALREIFFDGLYASEVESNIELSKLLPEKLPGVFPHNLSYYLSGFNFAYVENSAKKNILTWSTAIMGNQTCSLELDFDIAYLTEMLGDYSSAEKKYRAIAEKYTGHSGTQYRLGVLEQNRGNLYESISQHEKALMHSPSLLGSVDSLINLNSELSRANEVIKWCRYRANFQPYCTRHLESLLEMLVYNDSLKEALAELESRKRFCTNDYYIYHKSRCYTEAGLFSQALEIAKEVDHKSVRHLLVTKLIALTALEHFEEALNVCIDWLAQVPSDYYFVANKLELLVSLGRTDEVVTLSRQQLTSGDTEHCYIQHYFQLKKTSVKELQLLLEDVSTDRVSESVEAIVGQAENYLNMNDWKELLVFVNRHYPDAFNIRIALAYRHMMAMEHKQAIKIVEDIYQRSNQDAQWLYSLGKVCEDTQREKSLKLYQEYFDRTGDIDALIDIARCYHLNGDVIKARPYYQKAISLNPFADLAVNNLVQMGGDIAPYAVDFYRIIEAGCGGSTQYFCVNAVKCAIKAKTTVSPNWIAVAEKRLEMIEIEEPFKDEPQRLSLALYQWYRAKNDKEKARKFKKQAGLWGLLLSLTGWPMSKWIPDNG
ncbi:C39 family peptidase [Vibrio splendidus]|uniref:C39 family peptidase n=1 Tax=Vibrio splendidus TaxID=29497 RepID=UPI0024690FA6|nr:C39 family peptidase [Vibrio splendidus]MDH5932778.1 C39 family peptidase [Vibrio splendidus]